MREFSVESEGPEEGKRPGIDGVEHRRQPQFYALPELWVETAAYHRSNSRNSISAIMNFLECRFVLLL
ncbi:hypothetical protein R1flu_014900 [Riccia fluitans]|uniref:Uncharacterized protein n=1 Tax=Riccia fluitans TaxID=41844 RepID=A0ABD1YHE3_9MARC